jgi:hypothetical protein
MQPKCSVAIVSLMSMASVLGGCAASDKAFDTTKATVDSVVNKLPEWAGGPKQGLPPRPTDPGYAAYKRELEGKAAPAPATQPAKPASSNDTPNQQTTGK